MSSVTTSFVTSFVYVTVVSLNEYVPVQLLPTIVSAPSIEFPSCGFGVSCVVVVTPSTVAVV